MIDDKDIAYLVSGMALFGLTALPLVCDRRLLSVPTLYVFIGAVLALSPFALPVFEPLTDDGARYWIEHLTELIVIVALAGAGLAVDRDASTHGWQHSWVLLGIAMPLTIAGLYLMGTWAGLSVASAMLLAASLAPTDPVLAASVQVSGPNEGDEDDVRVSLTTEAGLNDGLAFPFVWLAIALAGAGATSLGGGLAEIGLTWLAFDVVWRILAAIAVGWVTGALAARFTLGRWGDARSGGTNAGLVFLGTTFLAYGLTEAIEGYGFLAVFLAARAGKAGSHDDGGRDYIEKPHGFGEQVEKILLALLLLWLGGFAVSGLLSDLRWSEVGIALALIFVLRPLVAYAGLICTRGDRFQRRTIAFFGIRGMGSFFYLAFAMGAAGPGGFDGIEAVWRITVIAVLVSIVVHGTLAPVAMNRLDNAR